MGCGLSGEARFRLINKPHISYDTLYYRTPEHANPTSAWSWSTDAESAASADPTQSTHSQPTVSLPWHATADAFESSTPPLQFDPNPNS